MTLLRTNVSFARGELAPSLYARPDLQDYSQGAKTVRNWMVERQGGVANRPGTAFVCEVKDSSAGARLIPFVFNNDQTYVLEFGNLYMRVIKDGAQVRLATVAISNITQASPGVVTYVGADVFTNGQEVFIAGVAGMTEINNRNFKIANVNAGANTFELMEMDGVTAFNTSTFTAYSSGGTSARVFEITTPYTSADVSLLDAHAQSADVIVITHRLYAPRELSRSSDTSWTLATISFAPGILPPHGSSATGGAASTVAHKYRVTAVSETGDESLPSNGPSQAITNITQANPAVVTYAGADNFNNGDEIFITGVTGMTQVNDRVFTVAGLNAGANTFQLLGVDSSAYTAYAAAGTVAKTFIRVEGGVFAATAANPIFITIVTVTGAVEYNVYRGTEGVFGFVGIAKTIGADTVFRDTAFADDQFDTPPVDNNKFETAGDYPRTSSFYQQRLALAGSDNNPTTVDFSRISMIYNFTRSTPIQDDDAITAQLAGTNRILHILDLGTSLSIFTGGGEWAILGGGQQGTLTPSDINARQFSYNGISDLFPLPVNRTAIYVQGRGNKVRDLLYDFASDGYDGTELSLKSAHLLDGYSIDDWAYQHNPHSIVWMKRSDGTLLGLTYVRDQEVIAWHRHDTLGLFENVCVVPEDTEDAAYFIVRRELIHPDTGATLVKRYIERLDSRFWSDVKDAKHVDCSLSYDGRNTNAANTVTINAAGTLATWAVSVTGIVPGNELHVIDSDGNIVKFTIGAAGIPPLTFALVPDRTLPTTMQNVAIANWAQAVDSVGGLWHLEGRDVSVQGDGFVVANPNNADIGVITVTDGTVSFSNFYGVIHVGLPYLSDLQTLDVETASKSLVNKPIMVNRVIVHVNDTRGVWAGATPPSDDAVDPTEGLAEYPPGESVVGDFPPDLLSEPINIPIEGQWGVGGSVFLRILDPVPARILTVIPSGIIAKND